MQPDQQYATVTVGDLDEATVAAVHATLLAPVFRPEELLSPADLRAGHGPGGSSPSTVLLAGDRPVAVMLGEWFCRRRALLLSYLSVSDTVRGAGLGTRLLEQALPTWWGDEPEPTVLAEVDDPAVWPADALGGDPRARLRFYARHGARLAGLPYVQPSLPGGPGRGTGMLLLRLRRGAGEPVAPAEFLRDYYATYEGPGAAEDPEVVGLLRQAAGLGEDVWWDVDRWPEVRGNR
ncbi:GNAT family N-acetyltransferase [Jannaschia sp. R86511]|uniref:GNAT family N-acetyltransferase n=1 Tax=Jannaschia sp. R86511 TaxID=3093853 RepID=UPI0036D3B993